MTTAASSDRIEGARQQRPPSQLAYLLSSYPAISHTFLLNEIVELRKLGFTIDVASINKPLWTAGATYRRGRSPRPGANAGW